MECGAIDYIKKPFDFDQFSGKVFRALEPAKGFRANSFHGFHLTDALQLVHMVGKSQTIRVKTEFGDECLIHLRNGEVVHSELEDLQGEEAFYRIIGLEGGEIDSLPLPKDTPTTIRRPLAALILEGMRFKDEKDAAKKGQRKGRKIVPEAATSGEKIITASQKAPLGSQTSRAKPEQRQGDGLKTADVVISLEQGSGGKANPAENEAKQPSSLSDKNFYRFVDQGFDCYKTGDLQEARECWEKALELRPDDRSVQFNLKKLVEK
jgi:hypothetical protein